MALQLSLVLRRETTSVLSAPFRCCSISCVLFGARALTRGGHHCRVCLSLISRNSALKPISSTFLFSSKLLLFCRCCCLCPSRPRYAPSVTIEEDNCCGCNAIAIRRHFLDENMTSVDIVYTSCHDAVRTCNPLGHASKALPNGIYGIPGVVVQRRKPEAFFLTLELPILSLHQGILSLGQKYLLKAKIITERSACT